jgi:hypothetical protein
MSPTGKGNDSPCIPHCARRGPVSCTSSGVRGGITGTEQGSTTRRRRICEICEARTEGAGRSHPCPPEAVYFRFCMSPTGKGNDSPCIPHCARRGPVSCTLSGVRAASPARSKAVQRSAGVSVKHAGRALRVQGDQLPARRRLFIFVSDFVCLRRARGMIPLASPVAPDAVRSAVPLRAYGRHHRHGARQYSAPQAYL